MESLTNFTDFSPMLGELINFPDFSPPMLGELINFPDFSPPMLGELINFKYPHFIHTLLYFNIKLFLAQHDVLSIIVREN